MIRNLILIGLLVLQCLVFCHDKNTNEPLPDITHPQVDIPWPLMADSPWPMPYGNAQCTGRTNVVGPTQGEIAWIYSDETMGRAYTSPVIGEDGTVYISDDRRLYAIKPDGSLKWKFDKAPTSQSCVLVGSGDVIYYITGTIYRTPTFLTYIYALDSTGSVQWEFQSEDMFANYGAGLGLDGTLYFTDVGGFLVAVDNNGALRWKTQGEGGFKSDWAISISFSPDGSTLYAVGTDSTINAVNTQTGDLIWQLPTGYGYRAKIAPLVDNAGNIYFFGREIDNNYVYSVNKKGELRWRYTDAEIYGIDFDCGMHMDYDGNLYFSNSKNVYSLTYEGKFNWKASLPTSGSVSPIIGDADNNIYIACWEEFIISYDQDGIQRFDVRIEEFGMLINGALADGHLYVGSSCKLICIK